MSKHHDILEIVIDNLKIGLQLFQLELKTAVNTYLFKALVLAGFILGLIVCICVLTALILILIFVKLVGLTYLNSLILTLTVFLLFVSLMVRIRIFPK